MRKKGRIHPRKKQKILERDNFTCSKCGITADFAALEVDHIVPICQGGENDYSNLQTLCYKCNMDKRWNNDVIKDSKIRLNIKMLENKSPREKLSMIKDRLNRYIDLNWNEFTVLFTQDRFFSNFNIDVKDIYGLFVDLGGKSFTTNNETHKWKKQRNAAIRILHKLGKTYKQIAELMKKEGSSIEKSQIGSIVSVE